MTDKYWDKALNPIQTVIKGKNGRGYHCTKISPGCRNCWAEIMNMRFGNKLPFDGTHLEFELNEKALYAPICDKKPHVYAMQWMGDLFHEDVPDKFRNKAYGMMALCPQHTFLALTKRPNNMATYINLQDGDREPITGCGTRKMVTLHALDICCESIANNPKATTGHGLTIGENNVIKVWPLPNVWHGLTVCNQQEADEKIPVFLQVPGKKFLSIEPLLGEINITPYIGYMAHHCKCGWHDDERRLFPQGKRFYCPECGSYTDDYRAIHSVILGGETGPHARPMHPDWVRHVRDDCEMAGVPFFLKFLNKKEGRVLDGKTHDELPWRNNAV